jgi:two-component system invasion response regulator UvrY
MKAKIALVDDHLLTRETMTQVINRFQHFEVIMQASDGKDFIEQIKKAEVLPDIVVLDLLLPRMDGLETSLWLQEHRRHMSVLICTMSRKYPFFVRLLQAGVKGILTKHDDIPELEAALHLLRQRKMYINKKVTSDIYNEISGDKEGDQVFERITKSEFRFMRLCCSELTYRAIADYLSVSPRTVDSYRDSLFAKLNVSSRTGLVLYAIRNGVVDLENDDPIMHLGKKPD